MLTGFLNGGRYQKSGTQKKNMRPQDVLHDPYLTSAQKRMVLEAMLIEARDESDNPENFKAGERQIAEIQRLQARLREKMD